MENNEIESVIKKQYYESGIASFLKNNSPELYIILIRQIIPKHTEMLECKAEIIRKKNHINELNTSLTEAEVNVRSCSAKLRFWEKEERISINLGKLKSTFNYWQVANIAFDWILKAGLTIVPILSLLGIAGIKLSNVFENDSKPFLFYTLFASISLIWLTSATIINWVISLPDSNSPKKYNILGNEFDSNSITFFILFGIWLAEALIGFALIPGLIDTQRTSINKSLDLSERLQMLNGIEKTEILLGVSIFAFINILFAVAKGRIYRFSSTRKESYNKAIAAKENLMKTIDDEVNEITALETKIGALDNKIINPEHPEGEYYFVKSIQDISIYSMQGKDYNPSFEYKDEKIDFNGHGNNISPDLEVKENH